MPFYTEEDFDYVRDGDSYVSDEELDEIQENEYEYEFEEEIHQNPFGLWPSQLNYEWRPNVLHLASLYAPVPVEPEPLLESVQDSFDTYTVKRREASHAKSQAEKKLATKNEELKKAEAEPEKPKTYASKWSDKVASNDGKKALVKRLGDECEALSQAVQAAVDTLSKLDTANAPIVKMKESHESYVAGYEEYAAFIAANSRKMWGKQMTAH